MRLCLRQKARKCSCLARQVFAGFDPMDVATLLATVHPRCMRLVWQLAGSNSNAAATEILVQERGSVPMARLAVTAVLPYFTAFSGKLPVSLR